MNRKNAMILMQYATKDKLADIALKEIENRKTNSLNIYYDIAKNEALVKPEDDKEGIPLRPLRTRLLKNGKRMNTEISSFIAGSIELAMEEYNKEKED